MPVEVPKGFPTLFSPGPSVPGRAGERGGAVRVHGTLLAVLEDPASIPQLSRASHGLWAGELVTQGSGITPEGDGTRGKFAAGCFSPSLFF